MNPDLKFTMEEENNGKLNYLDVSVIRNNDKIETTVYRKPTTNENIIPKKCYTQHSYKTAPLRSHIERAITICSNEKLLGDEIKKIENIAKKAGHDGREVRKIKERIEKRKTETNGEEGIMEERKYRGAITYMGKATEAIKKEFRKSDINIGVKPCPNIFKMIRNEKPRTDDKEQAGIYEIKIKNQEKNEENVYIGMTSLKIKERAKQHKSDVKHQRNTTALTRKIKDGNYVIDFENVKKLADYRNKSYALKREAIEILTNGKAINEREHATIDRRWQSMLGKTRRGGK